VTDAAQTTRERLLEAARELFTTTGYHDTTTPILARRAGVAEGTIYRHFPSKQALLNAAYQETQRWGAAMVREVSGGAPRTVGERLGTLGRVWLDHAEIDPARIRLLLAWRQPRELDELSRAAASEMRTGLEHLIALGKQQGTVRAGVVELWASVWLALVTFAAEKVANREWTASHPHAIATLDAAWEAIAWRPIVMGGATTPAAAAADTPSA
jgi:AcrR family transcriptional regulator